MLSMAFSSAAICRTKSTAASAVIALLVSFGLNISAEQTAALLSVVFIAAQAVQAIWTRRRVTPNTKVLELTDAARAWLGRVGYDPVYGARPLKRAVQKYLQDPLADLILKGEVRDGSTIRVDEGDGALRIAVG